MKKKTVRRANKKTPSTQNHLPIAEIRDDCVILKDGTIRAVLLVSSINFALKSQDEQQAIVSGYLSFLNSLELPLQIVVQSRGLDLDDYLQQLKQAEKNQENELLQLQITEYRDYISQLIELGEIMTKRFYLVIPYDPALKGGISFWRRIKDIVSPLRVINLKEKEFSRRRQELFSRVDKIVSGLNSIGLRSSVLTTQLLIELYYTNYNPVISKVQKMVDLKKLKLEEN